MRNVTLSGVKCKWSGVKCKSSDVKCSDMEWNDVIYVKWCFEVKWSELRWSSWGQNYHAH